MRWDHLNSANWSKLLALTAIIIYPFFLSAASDIKSQLDQISSFSKEEQIKRLNDLAHGYEGKSQYNEAIEVYRHLLKLSPCLDEATQIWLAISEDYKKNNQWGESLNELNAMELLLSPNDTIKLQKFQVLVLIADWQASQGEHQKAADTYKSAIDTYPAKKMDVLKKYADQLSFSGQKHLVIPLYEEAIKANPNDTAARDALVTLFLDFARYDAKNNNPNAAVNWYAAAIGADPRKRKSLLREYADALSKSGKGAEAIPLFKEVLANSPAPEEEHLAKLEMAQTYVWMYKYEDALKLYDEVLKTTPDDTEAKKGKAQVYIAYARYNAGKSNPSEAVMWFKKAIELDPSEKSNWLKELADQTVYSGDTNQAIPIYQEILAANPTGDYLKSVQLSLAEAYIKLFQYDDAQKLYDLLLQQNPYDQTARQGKAKIFIDYATYNSRLKHPQEAIDWYYKAIELDPNNQPELLKKIEEEKNKIGNEPKIMSPPPSPPAASTQPSTTVTPPSPPAASTQPSTTVSQPPAQLPSDSVPPKMDENTMNRSCPLAIQEEHNNATNVSEADEKKKHAKDLADQGNELAKKLEVFKAARAFEESIALDPSNRGVQEQYGWHLQSFAFIQEAVAQFYSLLPDAQDKRLMYQVLGWDSRALGLLDDSVWLFSHNYSIPPCLTLQNKFVFIGNTYRQGEYNKISELWGEAICSGGGDLELKKKLFDAYFYLGDTKEAVSLAIEILQEHPDEYLVHYRYAQALYQARKYLSSAVQHQLLQQKLPDNAFLYLSLGKVYEDMGCLCSAKNAYEIALSLDSNPKTERAYARILSKLGSCQDAEALALNIPVNENNTLTQALSEAEVQMYCENFEAASSLYNDILCEYPYHQEALWGLLRSSAETGNNADAFLAYTRWPYIGFDYPLQNYLAPYYRPPEVVLTGEFYQDSSSFVTQSAGISYTHYVPCNMRFYEGYYYNQYHQQHFKTIYRQAAFLNMEKLINETWETRLQLTEHYYYRLQHQSHDPSELSTDHNLYTKAILNYIFHVKCHLCDSLTADVGYEYYDVIDTIPPFTNPIYNYSNQIGAIALNIRTTDFDASINYSKKRLNIYANWIYGKYSDGNTKESRSFKVTYRYCDLPVFDVYYGYFYLDFKHAAPIFTQNGNSTTAYFDPKNFEVHLAGVDSHYNINECLEVGGELTLLYTPKCSNFGYSAFGYLNYKLTERLSIRLDLRYFYENQGISRTGITGYFSAENAELLMRYQF